MAREGDQKDTKYHIIKDNRAERLTQYGCFECGGEGHRAAEYPHKQATKSKKSGDYVRKEGKSSDHLRTSHSGQKKRRKGDPYYTAPKRQDMGIVRITELATDSDDDEDKDYHDYDDVTNDDDRGISDNEYDSGAD